MRSTPRLRTIFFAVNVMILLLPLGGIVLLRLYESVLIRRTESELIVQGAHVGASYQSAVREELRRRPHMKNRRYGAPLRPLENRWQRDYTPFEAKLDLAADPIYPPPETAKSAAQRPDSIAKNAGKRITRAMREAQKVTLAGIRVVDQHGVVVATTRTELGLSLAHRREVRLALRGTPIAMMRQRVSDEPPPPLDSISRGTKLRVFVAMPIIDQGRVLGAVLLSRTPQAVSQSLYTLRWHILAGAIVLLAFIAFISLLTSRMVTQPMEELIEQSERVARGERGAATPLSRSGTLEMRRVSEAIAHMAQSLEERADYINTFARGVSHEFKTPLASMRGAIELLRDHVDTMTSDERNQFLENLDKDTERLTRLVSRLTDLARADVIKPSLESSDIVATASDVVARQAAEGVAIKLEVEGDEKSVLMARETLESVISNLVDNARNHGGPNICVTVSERASDDTEERRVEISVVDDGEGISEANQKKVFERFFTTARNRGGSGLGLNIVKRLVEAHGGQVQLESEPGRTAVTIDLPSASPLRTNRSESLPPTSRRQWPRLGRSSSRHSRTE